MRSIDDNNKRKRKIDIEFELFEELFKIKLFFICRILIFGFKNIKYKYRFNPYIMKTFFSLTLSSSCYY